MLDGTSAIHEILAPEDGQSPMPRILVVTTFNLDEHACDALRADASGFLLMTVLPRSYSTPSGPSHTATPSSTQHPKRSILEQLCPAELRPGKGFALRSPSASWNDQRPTRTGCDTFVEYRHTAVASAHKARGMTEQATRITTSSAHDPLGLWLTMWNTNGDIARHICADDFRIHFAVTETDGSAPADAIRTAEDFAQYLGWWHEHHPGVTFTHIADAIDGNHGRLIWDLEAGDVQAGGVDVFDFAEDGRISRVWSVGGQRSMRS
jgi:hypothetical protein